MRTAISSLNVRSATTVRDALEMLRGDQRTPIAGATDLFVALNFGTLTPRRFVDIWRIDELRRVVIDGDMLAIGALVTYTELIRSPLIAARLPMLVEASRLVGGPQIQNRGTIGGNIANASPAGDTLPVLLAADAMILVGGQRGEREIAAKDFFVAYRKTALAPDELILHVRFPIPPGREMRFRKVGTRRAQAISKVVMALAWRMDGGVWRDVRVGLGSVAPTPVRVRRTEAILEGAVPDAALADRAAAAIAAEIAPIDDIRSTASYRRLVAGRVLRRLILDSR
ncbi:MAG TPA: xanthine dehydrogenase family protein subunit M [Gemmatimonadaceae bacterium]